MKTKAKNLLGKICYSASVVTKQNKRIEQKISLLSNTDSRHSNRFDDHSKKKYFFMKINKKNK